MEKLIIYKSAKQLLKNIYDLISLNESLKKDYSLNDQLKRAAISVILNIAEGYGRGPKLLKNCLRIAVGSANETVAALQIVQLVHNLKTEELQEKYLILAKQISSFSKSIPN